jgi:glycosyltransferase involved in cell wall biosynthesis
MDKTQAVRVTKVKGSPVFLWVGNLIARKDPLTVIKAFLKFAHYQSGLKLYMIYQEAELLDEINVLLAGDPHHKNSIVLVGPIFHNQLQYWYNSADFFILASHYEGSGVSVSEAMSCGCIPIISDFISFKKMTDSGRCGLLFEAGNEKDLLTAFF